ncbi:SRPBCC family protein [Alloalcanivorax gelatiniphagus]
MPHIERTITVPGRAEDVFAYLADFTTTEEWDPPTRTTELVAGEGGAGTRYRNVSKFLGKETETIYTVIIHDAPRRLELAGDASSMRLHDTITVEQQGGDVQVTYRAEFHPVGAAKLATPLLPPALKVLGDTAAKQMDTCLRRLPDAGR